MLGRLPWFAFDRRIRAFLFFVFFDMGSHATARSGGLHPAPQVFDIPGIYDPARRHVPLRGTVTPVRLPLELACGVGVRVDREVTAVVDRHLEQRPRRIQTLRSAV